MKSAKDIVWSFVEAINKEDFSAARQYAADDISFAGVLGTRNGADAYFNDMERMKLKFKVHKAFAEGDDVCLLYDVTMGSVTVYGCGWYQLKAGKIHFVRAVFDPRAVLEAAARQSK